MMTGWQYHEIPDDHGKKKKWDAVETGAMDAVPHRFDPLSTEDAEDDHEGMEEVDEVPSQRSSIELGRDVVAAEQLHPHHGEDEDDDCENETEVAKGTHRPTNNSNQQVQRWP